jgi:Transposase, Mutator family
LPVGSLLRTSGWYIAITPPSRSSALFEQPHSLAICVGLRYYQSPCHLANDLALAERTSNGFRAASVTVVSKVKKRGILKSSADGKKELIAIQDEQRESEQSWKEPFLDVQARGLTIDPALAVGDGTLGFWKALPQVFATTQAQRCWVHKTADVLDNLPKSVQPKAKEMPHAIYLAPSRAEAEKAFKLFVRTYEAKYPKATAC